MANTPAIEAVQKRPRRQPSERAMIRAAQSGSPEAIERLVRAYWTRAHRTAYLIVQDAAAAEDITQEAMMAVLGALHRFDRRRPIGPWLNRIVTNEALGWLRSRSRRPEVGGIEAAVEQLAAAPDRQLSQDMLAALATLEPEQRAVIVMRHVLGSTPGQIAKALGTPRGTVNSRMRRALDQLGKALGEEITP